MKENKKSQQGQGGRTGGNQNRNRGSNPTQGSLRNADVSAGDRGEETPPPGPNPDTPPNPSRREYDDTGHEHVYHPPKAPGKH